MFLSNPSLVVIDNQPAVLQVGDQVPVSTGSATVLTTNNTIVNTIDYRDTGIILRVVPRVNANGIVRLDIEQEISNVAPTSGAVSLTPTVSQRRVKSSVSVASGQTVLLAGLISERQQRSSNGIPFLDQLPSPLGDVFSTGRTNGLSRTELIIFIRPRLFAMAWMPISSRKKCAPNCEATPPPEHSADLQPPNSDKRGSMMLARLRAEKWTYFHITIVALIGTPFAVASLVVAPNILGVTGAGLALVMVAIAVINSRSFIIPDTLNLAALALAFANSIFSATDNAMEAVASAALRGCVLSFAFLGLRIAYRSFRKREGIGLGDVKLAGVPPAHGWIGKQWRSQWRSQPLRHWFLTGRANGLLPGLFARRAICLSAFFSRQQFGWVGFSKPRCFSHSERGRP